MPRFRMKPVIVEARQLTCENAFDLASWCHGRLYTVGLPEPQVAVITNAGVKIARPGDWIIKGVKGEFDACRADIFRKTYEPADDPEAPEAGVVVVPVEVAREYVESHRVPPTPNVAENQRRIERAIAATQRLDEHLASALSRIQQGGEGS